MAFVFDLRPEHSVSVPISFRGLCYPRNLPLTKTLMPGIIDDDTNSSFSDGGSLFSFSLTKLQVLVAEQLGTVCTLRKLAEGGNHKESNIKATFYASEAYVHRYTILSSRARI